MSESEDIHAMAREAIMQKRRIDYEIVTEKVRIDLFTVAACGVAIPFLIVALGFMWELMQIGPRADLIEFSIILGGGICIGLLIATVISAYRDYQRHSAEKRHCKLRLRIPV